MQFRQLRAIALLVSLATGLISCSDPVVQCQRLGDKTAVIDGNVVSIRAVSQGNTTDSMQVILEASADGLIPSVESEVLDLAALPMSDPTVKALQTRYVSVLQELHEAAQDWIANPSDRDTSRTVIEQKAAAAQSLSDEIRSTCAALFIAQ